MYGILLACSSEEDALRKIGSIGRPNFYIDVRLVDDEGRTVLFSTHHISEVDDISDQVGILHEGRIFWQGPVGTLADHVRQVKGDPPEGARLLHGGIAWGPPSVWRPDDEPVSLEAAFVAIAREDRA